jgi:hypothetical protein
MPGIYLFCSSNFLTCHPPPLDDLFICDVCETDGCPVLERSSGSHTERHPLIRCQAPVKDEETAPSTEERLASIEGRLDGMQSQFDDFRCRFGNIEQLLHKLVGTAGNTV